MAEEHRCQPPDGHRLCANNCGFLGSSATMNLCSNCYDLCLKQQKQSTVESSLSTSSSSVSSPPESSPSVSSPPESSISVSPLTILQNPTPESEITAGEFEAVTVTVNTQSEQRKSPNRCTTCRKRVGLTGFKCRCGTTFCGAHRYPEIHGCSFDFKSVGREEIAKANPLVKAAKLQKI